jgi:hypothetical protein
MYCTVCAHALVMGINIVLTAQKNLEKELGTGDLGALASVWHLHCTYVHNL